MMVTAPAEAGVSPDLLRSLLEGAVDSICNRQQRELNDVMTKLHAEVAQLRELVKQEVERRSALGSTALAPGIATPAPGSATPKRSASEWLSTVSNDDVVASGKMLLASDIDGLHDLHLDLPSPCLTSPRVSPRPVPLKTPAEEQRAPPVTDGRSCSSVDRGETPVPVGASKYGYSVAQMMELLSGGGQKAHQSMTCAESLLFFCVVASVLASIVSLGVSLDVNPKSSFWVTLEIACVFVFVVELLVKVFFWERWSYFFGPVYESGALDRKGAIQSVRELQNWRSLPRRHKEAWHDSFWNWFDCTITIASVIDLCVPSSTKARGFISMSLLRSFRLLRILRIVKLLRVPLVKDFMSIIFGVVLGTPLVAGYFWLLMVTLYVASIMFRLSFGPAPDEVLRCGFDEITDESNVSGECRLHEFFAHRYFGAMDTAMFTLYRCLTVDCSSVGGTSLIASFSAGYGLRFDIWWGMLSIWVLAGIVNIIMASLIGKTSGELEVRESMYIQDRLRKLAGLVIEYAADNEMLHNCRGMGVGSILRPLDQQDRWPRRGEITFSRDEFNELLGGPSPLSKAMRKIIGELGLNISVDDLFCIMDMDENGSVDAVEILDSLMITSCIQKAGTISTLVSLHGLSSKLNEMRAAPAGPNVAPLAVQTAGYQAGSPS